MGRLLNSSQIWSQVPVASRTVEVNTKTGFSLTAGSYSVRASSTQIGSMNSASTSATTTISSVTTTRTVINKNGNQANNTSIVECDTSIQLTNATTVTAYKVNGTGTAITSFMVMELF